MTPENGVKPDPTIWIPLLDEYHLTSLQHDTVLRGTLSPEYTPTHPAVQDALRAWPHPVHMHTEGDHTELVMVFEVRAEPARLPVVHLALFVATLLTTLGAGALMLGVDPFRTRFAELGTLVLPYPSDLDIGGLWRGASFALPFLAVLLGHEMGHYAAARAHRVRVSLPYFIPFPPYFSVIGSLGAFIKIKGPSVRRSILFDIGAAGPFVSFLGSLPLFALGLRWSEPVASSANQLAPFAIRFAGQPIWLGNGLATHLLASLFGPAEVGTSLIVLHPVALAGWLGLFVTALNLLPLGQLDGGHVLYSLFPERHARFARLFLMALVPLGWLWWGWWAWAVLVLVIHRGRVRHPSVLQPRPPLERRRRWLGWALVVIFFATFVPIPIEL